MCYDAPNNINLSCATSLLLLRYRRINCYSSKEGSSPKWKNRSEFITKQFYEQKWFLNRKSQFTTVDVSTERVKKTWQWIGGCLAVGTGTDTHMISYDFPSIDWGSCTCCVCRASRTAVYMYKTTKTLYRAAIYSLDNPTCARSHVVL